MKYKILIFQHQRKKNGGLGIRGVRNANATLLAKIGAHLIGGANGLWAEVLKAKYVKDTSVMEVVYRLTNSYL